MAKAKSKKITLEEALVPVEEQPYKVPENWCWIHLLDSFDNVTDSKKKLATKEYLEDGEYPIIDQGQDFIGGYTDDADMIYKILDWALLLEESGIIGEGMTFSDEEKKKAQDTKVINNYTNNF